MCYCGAELRNGGPKITSYLDLSLGKGKSAIHIGLLLQETVASALETQRKSLYHSPKFPRHLSLFGHMVYFTNFTIWELEVDFGILCIECMMVSKPSL